MSDDPVNEDQEDVSLVICDHAFSEEEINVTKQALKAFAERLTPMYLGREAISFLKKQRDIAFRLFSSILSVNIIKSLAKGSITFTIQELQVLRDSLSFFVGLDTSLFKKKEDVLQFRHDQATALRLLSVV